ncbi:MAG TPA: GEVED domain-containing protein [Flavipsychrobacter sp.]
MFKSLHTILTVSGLLLSAGTFAQSYCTPTLPTPCNDPANNVDIRINRVRTTGGTANISNTTNGCSAGGYAYFTGANNTIMANAGAVVVCSVDVATAGAYSYRCAVWVDWNDDGDFTDAGEAVYSSQTSQTAGPYPYATPPNNFTVPLYAKEGMKRMRVFAGTRALGDFAPTTWSSCPPSLPNNAIFGEYEDYDFYVVNPCTMKPLKVEELVHNGFNVRFNKRPNAEMYEYFLSNTLYTTPPPGNGWTLTADTLLKFPQSNYPVECDKKYYVYVRSICDTAGLNQNDWLTSDWMVEEVITPPCCYMPEVTITNVTSNTAIASWTPVPSVYKYEYLLSMDTVPAAGTWSGHFTFNTGVPIQGLQPGRMWYFFLRAYCNPTPTSEWSVDSFLTKPPTAVPQVAGKEFGIIAYPNPVKDVVTLELAKGIRSGKAKVIVTDITGKVVTTAEMEKEVLELNLSGKPAGTYIIKYADDAHTDVIHVSKQ